MFSKTFPFLGSISRGENARFPPCGRPCSRLEISSTSTHRCPKCISRENKSRGLTSHGSQVWFEFVFRTARQVQDNLLRRNDNGFVVIKTFQVVV